jgi:hypothetical protein
MQMLGYFGHAVNYQPNQIRNIALYTQRGIPIDSSSQRLFVVQLFFFDLSYIGILRSFKRQSIRVIVIC